MRIVITLLISLFTVSGFAQKIEKSVIANAGTISAKSDVQLSWTMGESAVLPLAKSDMELRQGYQQRVTGFGTGIKSVSQDVIKLYPNPVRDLITLETSAMNSISHVQILSTDGRLVRELLINKGSRFHVNMTDLTSGNYTLKITTKSGEQSHHLISKL